MSGWGMQIHSLAQFLSCVLVFVCASVMYTYRADLDDKRVILPCWVGHLKDNHFSGSSAERSMMEREGWTGRMLRSLSAYVCVWCRREREEINSQWGQSNKEQNSSRFLYVSWAYSTFIPHTYKYTTHAHRPPQTKNNYIPTCGPAHTRENKHGGKLHILFTDTNPPTHTLTDHMLCFH